MGWVGSWDVEHVCIEFGMEEIGKVMT